MRRAALPLALSLFLCFGGCRTFQVDAFGVPLNSRDLGHHAKLDLDGLDADEKTGVWVTVGLAVAAITAWLIAAS